MPAFPFSEARFRRSVSNLTGTGVAAMKVRRWTEREDQILRAHPKGTATALLKGRRTHGAVKERRRILEISVSKKLRWTAEEDEIVISHTVKDAAILLRGCRSEDAVKFRRRAIGICVLPKLWSKAEDRRIHRTAAWPMKKALKVLPGRTVNAIRLRRQRLGHYRPRGPCAAWLGSEVKQLRQMWPTGKLPDILKAFPRHPRRSICYMAKKQGLRKTFVADPTDLLDQIRSRAHEDGISLTGLKREVDGLGSLFRHRPNAGCDFNKVARIVDFFGGRLMIDWCDE